MKYIIGNEEPVENKQEGNTLGENSASKIGLKYINPNLTGQPCKYERTTPVESKYIRTGEEETINSGRNK